jgi:hypothetical protein
LDNQPSYEFDDELGHAFLFHEGFPGSLVSLCRLSCRHVGGFFNAQGSYKSHRKKNCSHNGSDILGEHNEYEGRGIGEKSTREKTSDQEIANGERSFSGCRLCCIAQKVCWLNVVQKAPPPATSREIAPAPGFNTDNILGLREAGCKRIFFIGRIENYEVWGNFLRQVVSQRLAANTTVTASVYRGAPG